MSPDRDPQSNLTILLDMFDKNFIAHDGFIKTLESYARHNPFPFKSSLMNWAQQPGGDSFFHCVASYPALSGTFSVLAKALGPQKAVLVMKMNKAGYTPLHIAAYIGSRDTASALINVGAKVDGRDTSFTLSQQRVPPLTPLQIAALRGHHQMVDDLLVAGASPNLTVSTSDGRTALTLASQKGHAEVVETMLCHTAIKPSKSIKDEKGYNAFLWACQLGHANVASLFIKASKLGAILQSRTSQGKNTGLHLAARFFQDRVVMELLKNKKATSSNVKREKRHRKSVEYDRLNQQGHTPLSLMLNQLGHLKSVKDRIRQEHNACFTETNLHSGPKYLETQRLRKLLEAATEEYESALRSAAVIHGAFCHFTPLYDLSLQFPKSQLNEAEKALVKLIDETYRRLQTEGGLPDYTPAVFCSVDDEEQLYAPTTNIDDNALPSTVPIAETSSVYSEGSTVDNQQHAADQIPEGASFWNFWTSTPDDITDIESYTTLAKNAWDQLQKEETPFTKNDYEEKLTQLLQAIDKTIENNPEFVSKQDQEGNNALHRIAGRPGLSKVLQRYLQATGQEIENSPIGMSAAAAQALDTRNQHGFSPIDIVALHNSDSEMIDLFLVHQRGATLPFDEPHPKNQMTPLLFAAHAANATMVKALLGWGLNANFRVTDQSNSPSPLSLAFNTYFKNKDHVGTQRTLDELLIKGARLDSLTTSNIILSSERRTDSAALESEVLDDLRNKLISLAPPIVEHYLDNFEKVMLSIYHTYTLPKDVIQFNTELSGLQTLLVAVAESAGALAGLPSVISAPLKIAFKKFNVSKMDNHLAILGAIFEKIKKEKIELLALRSAAQIAQCYFSKKDEDKPNYIRQQFPKGAEDIQKERAYLSRQGFKSFKELNKYINKADENVRIKVRLDLIRLSCAQVTE